LVALLKLILVFAGIVFLLSRKWDLGLVLLLASGAAGILFGHPFSEIGRDILFTIVNLPALRQALQANGLADALAALHSSDLLALRLALIVVLIMVLGELLRQTAGTKQMVEALQALVPNGRIVIAALPALIGLLPMVGGAMFSAPMVDEVGDRLGASRERKTFVNYWFRHIWEPALPLYPSVMLGAALLGLTTIQMTRMTWPLSVSAVLGGLLFGLMRLPRQSGTTSPPGSRLQNLWSLAASTWPIALATILSTTLPVDERLALVVSLLITIGLMMAVKHIPPRDLVSILCHHIPWKTVAVIFGALIFRRVLENSGAVVAVSDGLTDLHIPLVALAFGVPFISGLLTGLMPAGFSIGFPVILPLVTPGGQTIPSAWAVWMMAGGVVGTMLSPVHLCLALTRVYFKAEWGPVYRFLVPSACLVAGVAAAMLLFGG
jgi:integral membrane protein (TIGR00529 family)